MEKRNANILFTFLITISCFFAVVYTSCSKSNDNPASCDGILCQNGGQCRNGKCVCPYGYEGANCEKNYHDKYIGGWNVHETLIGSSVDTHGVKRDSLYTILIVSSSSNPSGVSSPTSFFIQQMLGNPSYVNLACVVDTPSSSSTTNSSAFYISANQIIGGGKLTVYSGTGNIDNTLNTITGVYVRNRLGSSTTIYDTLTFTMSRQ